MSDETMYTTSWWEEYRSAIATGERLQAEVYVRSHAPTPGGHSRRQSVFRMLDGAVADQVLDSYDVTIIGDALCLCENCVDQPPGRKLIERFAAIWDWSRDAVEPLGFEEREVDSSVTGEKHRILVPPELCLLTSIDEELVGVFPCTIDGTPYTVEDFLEILRSDLTGTRVSRADA